MKLSGKISRPVQVGLGGLALGVLLEICRWVRTLDLPTSSTTIIALAAITAVIAVVLAERRCG